MSLCAAVSYSAVIGLGAGGMMGWELGTTEAIAAVIVIGFSVDYCVHLANAYVESAETHREVGHNTPGAEDNNTPLFPGAEDNTPLFSRR